MTDSTQQAPAITAFLEARIAEDESLARAVLATVAPDEWENPTQWGNFFPEDVAFWDAQTPHRVLAECATKRALIADHAEFVGAVEYLSAALPGDLNRDPSAPWRTSTFRRLAAVYVTHPDYQQEWAIDG